MEKIKVANAPCSWGALEFDLEAKAPDHLQVLQEIRDTGYVGTELGDWGFMPTEPGALHAVVDAHKLDLIGAFVPVALASPEALESGVTRAVRVAQLLKDAGYAHAFIVLADENGTVPERTNAAGRIKQEQGLTAAQWEIFASGANAVAKAVKEQTGLRTVFHHHGAGYVETPTELETLLRLTDPQLLGLCFDTGHFAFAGGDPVQGVKKYIDRIWHVHFKDYEPALGEQSKEKQWDYFESVRRGIFCELGKGNVDFGEVLSVLKENDYQGWIVVEQDVLPGMGTPKICAQNNRTYLQELGI